MDKKSEVVAIPEDMSTLKSEELTALQTSVLAEFDTLAANDDINDEGVARLQTLATTLETIKSRQDAIAARGTARSAALATASKLRPAAGATTETFAAETTVTAESESGTDDDGDDDGTESAPPEVTASAKRKPARVPALSQVAQHTPNVPANVESNALTVTAAAPAHGLQMGAEITNLDSLVSAVQSHARGMVTTSGRPGFQAVATVQNDFEYVIDGQNTKPGDFEEMIRQLRSPDKIDSLVAAGGWCAPSETRYDFFNIACQDGMIDLPTFGVRRGGITFPVSPSLADVYTGSFTNATNPWLWTEADDQLAVTGSPTKPCVRVPCADFDEVRLECYGICLTAGNLTDSAFPEATRNYLQLLLAAHYHAMNARYIAQMVTLSTAATVIPTGACRAVSADLPDFVGLAAQDYRTRYGMCDDDVLEVVLPRWARDAIRSDLSRRTGIDPTNFTNADIDAMFTTRRVRIQWVADWQVRSAGQPGGASALTAWPDTLDFMIYAAGTFVRGNGLTLDLGVVRDSVLNETNDHTAAWTEECHLIAQYGHESRLYTMPVCVGGLTGGTCTECHVA